MDTLKKFWISIRSNPYFVAFEGGATGALGDFIADALSSGHLDFSRAGLQKLAVFALTGGLTAVRLLVRPVPPSTKDVPAIVEPVDPKTISVKEIQ